MKTLSKGQVGYGAGQQWAILYDGPLGVNKMATNESNYGTLPKSIVGYGAGQHWAALYGANKAVQYTPPSMPGITESGFLSKGVVGAGAGQDWALMYDRNGLIPNGSHESNFKINLPAFRRAFCRKYVKSLGYLRREGIGGDKVAYIQAMNDCLVHFSDIKKGAYKIKPADKFTNGSINIDSLLVDSERETGVNKNDPALNNMARPSSDEMERTSGGSNTMMYVMIAVAILIIIAMFMYFRSKNKAAA